MQTKHSGMIEKVRDAMVAAIEGTGDIVQATVGFIHLLLVLAVVVVLVGIIQGRRLV